MTQEKNKTDNFNSTANLTTNGEFSSTFSISSKDTKDEKPYNPIEHRNLEHPNSFLRVNLSTQGIHFDCTDNSPSRTVGSLLHLLKACLGTGILAMPAAFKNSGLVAGVVGTLLAGLICTHTVHVLVRASQELCVIAKKPSMGFADTCGAAFTHGPKSLRSWGGTAKTIIDYSMAITYFSVLCVYVVFIGSSFKEVLDVYMPELQISIQTYCVLMLVPLVVICQIRNLKYLVPFSAIANVLIVVVFAITLYYVFVDLPPISEREMVAQVSQWPLFLSTVIFAMEGIGVVMPVENEMARPQRFLGCPGVLNTAMIIVITLYGIVGFFGYVQYGNEVKGSVTLNLPQDEIVAQSAKLIMAIVIYFSYALQFYVPMEMINRLLQKRNSSKYENVIQIGIRTVVVTLSVAIAAAFPNLELVISFVGAIFFSTLGLLIPAIIDTVFLWDRDLGRFNYVVIKNVIIGIISLIALVSGSYVSVVGMIEDFSGHSNHHNITV